MATLRMVLIDCETDSPEQAAEILRMALHGVEAVPAIATVSSGPKAPAALPEAEREEPRVAPKGRQTRKSRREDPPEEPEPELEAPKRDGRVPEDGPSAAILAALGRGPLSSAELIEKTRRDPQVIYQTASVLKKKGAIDNRVSDQDGQRRWFLVV